jgi:hypothetical protein
MMKTAATKRREPELWRKWQRYAKRPGSALFVTIYQYRCAGHIDDILMSSELGDTPTKEHAKYCLHDVRMIPLIGKCIRSVR